VSFSLFFNFLLNHPFDNLLGFLVEQLSINGVKIELHRKAHFSARYKMVFMRDHIIAPSIILRKIRVVDILFHVHDENAV